MQNMSQILDVILEEPSNSYNIVDIAGQIVRQLEDTQRRILELQNQLLIAKNRMCGELALSIRRRMPGLNIGVSRDGCKVGYRTKHMILNPDPGSGIWKIKSGDNRFARKFLRLFGTSTVISQDINPLADNIISFFRDHYKTLGEDIDGTGIVFVEDKRGTITDLAVWYESQEIGKNKHINSRSMRK